jgi:sugar O-acyltransferase (sialic acid O-acetyltransferase NeuD family)
MKKILLAGNSITADIIYSYIRTDSRYQVVGSVVDDEFVGLNMVNEVESVGISKVISKYPVDQVSVIMAMGYDDINQTRESMFYKLKEMSYKFETYVHNDSLIYTHHKLGEGCVVLPGSVIEPHVKIGDNTMVWCNVTVAHHSEISNHCWLASGAVLAGQSKIFKNCFIGVNSTIVNNVSVGEYNIVGANALVSKNTKDNQVYLARSGELFKFPSSEYVQYFKF